MKLTLPYPPTANLYWRVFRGVVVKSLVARNYQTNVKFRAMQDHSLPEPEAGPVVVSVTLYRPSRRGDLDNSLKVLLDSLKGLAFVDDAQVVEIHASRFEDPANPRAVVSVEAAAAPPCDERPARRTRGGGQ